MPSIEDDLASTEAVAIPLITMASLSLIASMSMAIMIPRTEKGLSTPYRRIIFGLSISDILQSFSFFVGPFAVPHDLMPEFDSWGVGNKATCQATGFLFTAGSTLVPKYTCFLCWYYLCKLKYRMTNETFSYKYEWRLHILINLYALLISASALGIDLYHPAFTRTHCQIAAFPTGCRFFPEEVGECEPDIGARATLFMLVDYFASNVLALVGIIIIMAMLYWHAVIFSRIHEPEEEEQNIRQSRLRHLSSAYRTETILQASLYVLAFLFAYLPTYVTLYSMMSDGKTTIPPKIYQILPYYSYPVGGVFNIFVYTRPYIANLRRDHPDRSMIQCFLAVLRAGGELP